MKLVARLPGEHPQLVEGLKQKGWKAKHVRGAVVADMPIDRKRAGLYLMPPGLESAEVLIEAAESGGSGAHNGQATVVCGLSGKRMRPYFKPTEGEVSGYFAAPVGLCIIQATSIGSQPPTLEGSELTVKRTTEGALLQRRQLFHKKAEPGADWGVYATAVKAAVLKVRCRGCRHLHYGEVT